MRYSLHIDIALPRDRVIELFDDQENLFQWMEGLVSCDLISGEAGQVGARSKMVFQMGKRRIEMIETITVRNLPDEFSCTYEAPGVWNEVQNHFAEIGPEETQWTTHNHFRFKGLFMRLMGFLMPGAFRKQSYKYLERFKAFAESQGK